MRVDVSAPGEHRLTQAIEERVASRLFAQDATLWGPEAESEAQIRLSWTHLDETSRQLVPEVEHLREELRSKGLTHVVLCGMGGSSLAPEVICKAAGVELTVLDSSHPDTVRHALTDRLAQSVVVVSSKSGSTVETDSLLRAYVDAFTRAGHDPADHLVVVTDPGSPFDRESTAAGYRVFRADPNVGGRYSALSAFGLVPSGLAGADIAALLTDATELGKAAANDQADNPALELGVALGSAAVDGVDKLVLCGPNGLGDWIEQLVAESTGKVGKGILPVVVPSRHAPNFTPRTADSFLVSLDGDARPDTECSALVAGPLGAQFMLWEAAVAIAGWVIGIDPFDQPDVESAKAAARELLTSDAASTANADLAADGIAVFGTTADTLESAIDEFVAALDPDAGYLAIQAYLDRLALPEYEELRELLATRTGRPVTFGWGPRFLHSTGQYHKGGPPTGVFLQLTDAAEDLAIPGREFTFGSFIAAQAAGDATVLRSKGRPVLRLHLTNAQEALPRLRTLLA